MCPVRFSIQKQKQSAYLGGASARRRSAPLGRAVTDDPLSTAASHFSYAAPDDGWAKRVAIRAIERATGQPKLHRMYLDYREHFAARESLWDAAVRYLNLDLQYDPAALDALPSTGPLVVVCNHPFGVADGLVIGHLISKVRQDFLILTNSVLYRAEEARPFLLPVDFAETQSALQTNIVSRRRARDHIKAGGCLVIFPGGGVSTAPKPFAKQAVDPEWKTFTANLIEFGRADVVPIYFEGQNSRLFQVASHLSLTLRLSLLFKEVNDRIGKPMHIKIGAPISSATLSALGDRRKMMEFLRQQTYALGNI